MSSSHQPSLHRSRAERLTLAVAVAALERMGGPADDARIVEALRGEGLGAEEAILRRAEALAAESDLERRVDLVRSIMRWAVLLGIGLAGLAGASAGFAALVTESGQPISVLPLLVGVLGGQLLLLVLWFLIACGGATMLARYSLARPILALGRRLATIGQRAPDAARASAAAVEATIEVGASAGAGRWTLGTIVHALWVSFNVGVLVAMLVLFTVRQREFGWESTILTAEASNRMVDAFAALPRRLGLPAPDHAMIADSRIDPARRGEFGPQSEAERQAWAWFLVGAVLTYGLAPRAILFGACVLLRHRALRAVRLKTDAPPWSLLADRLRPGAAPLARWVAGPSGEAPQPVDAAVPAEGRGRGTAIVGLEMTDESWCAAQVLRIAEGWGNVSSREERAAFRERLKAGERPARLVVVASLRATPDRGAIGLLAEAARAMPDCLDVVLTDGDRLRRRGDVHSVASRVGAWREALIAIGVSDRRIHEIDLERLTEASAGRLAAILGNAPSSPRAAASIDAAFALIQDHAVRWSDEPTPGERLALERALVDHFGASDVAARWWRSLGSTIPSAERVREAARSWQALLPPSLRIRPRWLAAGGAAGALGCVAAATFLFPPTVAALPVWTGLGSLVGGVLGALHPQRPPGPSAASESFDQAIRSATLSALVYGLQGQGEARIASLLEQALDADEDPIGRDRVGLWLRGIAERLDAALSGGGGS